MNGWEQGGGQTGEDHMGCWQCSWWDSGSPAGGYIHGEGSHGILAIKLVAIYSQSVSQSVSQKISHSVNQSGVKEEEDLT